MSNFRCHVCGKEFSWEERDYDTGLKMAQQASFDALGHTEDVTPYLVCTGCSVEIKKELGECT